MCVQPPSCSKASVRSNSAFEYSGSASIMSPQISGNPASRAQASACVAPAAVWVRPNRCSCASSALCTPKLMRVTPACRKPTSVSGVTTSGLASSVISAPGRGVSSLYQGADLLRRKQRRCAAAEIQRVGATTIFGKLPQQGVYIRLRHAARPRCRVKITVAAFGFAIGNMNVNAKRRFCT